MFPFCAVRSHDQEPLRDRRRGHTVHRELIMGNRKMYACVSECVRDRQGQKRITLTKRQQDKTAAESRPPVPAGVSSLHLHLDLPQIATGSAPTGLCLRPQAPPAASSSTVITGFLVRL